MQLRARLSAAVLTAAAVCAAQAPRPAIADAAAPSSHPQAAHAIAPPAAHSPAAASGPPGTVCSGCGSTFTSHGGPVQHNPQAFAIFWGSTYNATTRSDVNSLMGSLRGSAYNNILTLYGDSSSLVNNDVVLAGSYTDPTPPAGTVDSTTIGAEIAKVRQINGWGNSGDAQFMVFTPSGAGIANPFSPKAFCGYHSTTSDPVTGATYIFSLMPWLGDQPFSGWGCLNFAGGNVALSITTVASHEYAEAATDPFPLTGWNSPASGGPWEIADICNWAPSASLFGVQVTYLFDRVSGQCVTSLVTPFTAADAYLVLMDHTGTGRTEVHVLNGGADYKSFKIEVGSALAPSNPADWQFVTGAMNGNGLRDIIAICMRQCGTQTTEIHILDGGNNYQSFKLHVASALGPTNPQNWSFIRGHVNSTGFPDVIALCMRQCGSQTTEVHILDGTRNYSAFKLHSTSALGPTSPDQWKFVVGNDSNGNGFPDINCILMNNSGSGRTEVHILSGAATYQSFRLHTATALGATNAREFQFAPTSITAGTGYDDIIAVHMDGSYGRTEVHILNAAATYGNFRLEIVTALGSFQPVDGWMGSNVWYTGIDDFSISASPSTLKPTVGGGSARSTILLGANNAFLGSVALSASGVPSGTSVSFSPGSVGLNPDGSGSSTMTVTLGLLQATSFTITVTGCGNGTCHSTSVTVQPTA
jgi:hypothetical protein